MKIHFCCVDGFWLIIYTMSVFWRCEFLLYNHGGNCLFLSDPNQRQTSICWISVSQARNQQKQGKGWAQLAFWFFWISFLLGLVFDFEERVDMFLQTVNCLLPDYTALHPPETEFFLNLSVGISNTDMENFLSVKECPWWVYPFLATQIYFGNFRSLPKQVLNQRRCIMTPFIKLSFRIATFSNVCVR
jgi:hypothetical protein